MTEGGSMKVKNVLSSLILVPISALVFSSCASNPNKAEKIDTSIDSADQVSGDTELGVKGGNMVVQKKVMMGEELRKLQYEVYELEDRVYGNRKYGSLGLYGVLRDCKLQLAEPKNGGDGKLMWTEPMDRVTDKEDEFKMGLDDKKKLVGVTEEFLTERIARFRGYRTLLNKRQDEYEEKVAICKSDLNGRMNRNR
jgi:hypothetical protein